MSHVTTDNNTKRGVASTLPAQLSRDNLVSSQSACALSFMVLRLMCPVENSDARYERSEQQQQQQLTLRCTSL